MTKRVNAIAGAAVLVLVVCTCGAGLIWAKKKGALTAAAFPKRQSVFARTIVCHF